MRRLRSFQRASASPCGGWGPALLLFVAVAVVGCGGGSEGGVSETGGSTQGGASGGGGGPPASTGGTSGTGGARTGGATGTSSGGAPATSTGGNTSTGGMTASGGESATGGVTATGGAGGTQGQGGAGNRGATGGAGTAGRMGTGGAAGGGNSGGCNVTPVDPAATAQVKSLLCYLNSINGNHVLSGQQETSWSNPAGDISYYSTNIGKYPAILGGDYLYPSGTTSRALAYWQAGGLTMMRYHMGAPPLADTYPNSEMSTNYANVLTTGTAENTALLSKLDYLARELKTLQDGNAAVILALFHEVQPNGWFWWAKGTGDQFKQLWQLAFNYLTKTKGIHNVIWLCPFSGSPSAAYFPGKDWVDLSGPDEYANPNSQPFTSNYAAARTAVGNSIPMPLHETGAVPQPASMFPSTAPWLLWNIWCTYENSAQNGVTYNTVASLKMAYSSSYTITRDLLPKF